MVLNWFCFCWSDQIIQTVRRHFVKLLLVLIPIESSIHGALYYIITVKTLTSIMVSILIRSIFVIGSVVYDTEENVMMVKSHNYTINPLNTNIRGAKIFGDLQLIVKKSICIGVVNISTHRAFAISIMNLDWYIYDKKFSRHRICHGMAFYDMCYVCWFIK